MNKLCTPRITHGCVCPVALQQDGDFSGNAVAVGPRAGCMCMVTTSNGPPPPKAKVRALLEKEIVMGRESTRMRHGFPMGLHGPKAALGPLGSPKSSVVFSKSLGDRVML